MGDVTVYRECGQRAAVKIVDEQVQLKLDDARPIVDLAVRGETVVGMFQARRLASLIDALDGARETEIDCVFEGDVEAHRSGPPNDGKLVWTCPLCGHEHEEVD